MPLPTPPETRLSNPSRKLSSASKTAPIPVTLGRNVAVDAGRLIREAVVPERIEAGAHPIAGEARPERIPDTAHEHRAKNPRQHQVDGVRRDDETDSTSQPANACAQRAANAAIAHPIGDNSHQSP